MSNPKAQVAKEKGNVAFKSGDYPLAVGHYTSAIMADNKDPTYPLNRAAAYLKLGKNEDAERDCNVVLALSPSNVKALFRRGQARFGMDKLLESQNDFNDVLRIEPANLAAQEELKKVVMLIMSEKAKRKNTQTPNSPFPSIPTAPAPNAKRRRVPIKIVDASGSLVTTSLDASVSAATSAKPQLSQLQSISPSSSSTPAASSSLATKTKTEVATAPASKSDTLNAISSRSLKNTSTAPADAPAVPAAFTAAVASLQPEGKENSGDKDKNARNSTPKVTPASFQQAKQARETARPSRVGGGIFRSSGENTIFASRGGEEGITKSHIEEVVEEVASPTASPVPESAPQATTASVTTFKAPSTYFDFNRAWHSLRSPEERWVLLNTIPPTQLPALCKTSLEPALLISILDVFLTLLTVRPDDAALSQKVLEYMQNLVRIPRFGTLVLFLSKPEKTVAKDVWGLLGMEPIGSWRAVGY